MDFELLTYVAEFGTLLRCDEEGDICDLGEAEEFLGGGEEEIEVRDWGAELFLDVAEEEGGVSCW